MIERLREMGILPAQEESEAEDGVEESPFRALRLLTAELFLASGINATIQYLRERGSADAEREYPITYEEEAYSVPRGAAWAPALLAPLAGAAHAVHALQPSDRSQLATRVLNGAAIGLGVAGVVDSIYGAARGKGSFSLSLAPLLFSYAGVLGFFLDRQESKVNEEREALEHRARIIERLVPRRRPKLDRIVVHV